MTPSRRQTASMLATAGLASLLPRRAVAIAESPAPVKDWLLAPDAKPLNVPADYIGIHFDNGVNPASAPQPTYPFDALRSHDVDNGNDMPATQWADIEVKPGVFDWHRVDTWMTNNADKTRIWVLFGTPKFYQKYPGEPFPFVTLPGGGSPPINPATAATFIKALLARYPNRFKYVELWNEPNFGGGTNPQKDRWTPRASDPAWFSGTASELATLARHVKGALTPDVKLMASGWAWQAKQDQLGAGNAILQFANASDGAGGFGRDHIDALSVHLYVYNFDANAMVKEIRTYEQLFVKAGFPSALPRFNTESGAHAWGGDESKFTATNPTLPEKIRIVKRVCMIPAAMGYQGTYLYRHSLMGSLGDPAHVPEIAAAIAEMRDGLRGKKLERAAVLNDDRIWLAFVDGSSLVA